jgi:hypothetical protein
MKLLIEDSTPRLSLLQDGWIHRKVSNTGWRGLYNRFVIWWYKRTEAIKCAAK